MARQAKADKPADVKASKSADKTSSINIKYFFLIHNNSFLLKKN